MNWLIGCELVGIGVVVYLNLDLCKLSSFFFQISFWQE